MHISLKDQLDNRLEYKFWISNQLLDEFRSDMIPYMNLDPYASVRHDKQYTVRSIYLDTNNLKSYHQKMDGVQFRNKFRIRGYNESSDRLPVYLEIKKKKLDFISKVRVKTGFGDFLKLIQSWNPNEIASFSDPEIRESANTFIYHYLSENLHPVTNVTYDREAFFCKYESNLRISFDKSIRTRKPESVSDIYGEHNLMICRPGFSVIEVKFFQVLPVWVPMLISKYKLKREAISKYTLCVDTIHKQQPVFSPHY